MRTLSRLSSESQDDGDDKDMSGHKYLMIDGETSSRGDIEEDVDVKISDTKEDTE